MPSRLTLDLDLISRPAKGSFYIPALANPMSMELQTPNPGRVPIIVAKAMSSVGFALSVFAIWLDWVCPVVKPSLPDIRPSHSKREKSRRRRSAPASLGASAQRKSRRRKALPIRSNTSPLLDGVPPQDAVGHAALATQQTRPVLDTDVNSPPKQPDLGSQASFSSSSTIPITPPQHLAFAQPQLDPCDESLESDGSHLSSRPSIASASARLARMKLFMGKTRKPSLSTSPSVSTPEDLSEKSARGPNPDATSDATTDKTSMPHRSFFARRPLSARPTTSPSPATSTPPKHSHRPSTPPPSSATSRCFSRKSDRRRSAPVPRTQPYDYPYFAAMPTSGDDKTFVEEPVTVDEVGRLSGQTLPQTHPGGSDLRQINANAQADLGVGHRPSPKGRSTSERLTQRRASLQS